MVGKLVMFTCAIVAQYIVIFFRGILYFEFPFFVLAEYNEIEQIAITP